ncbi:MAG: hypothetical protein R3D00_15240 [Bacteroidia bacterium]
MENQDDFDLIEDYLEGLLDDKAARTVEDRLANDASFASVFRKHQAAHTILKIGAGIHLKKKLSSRTDFSQTPQSHKVYRLRWYWALAAGLALVLLIAGFRYGKFRYSDENLVKYYTGAYAGNSLRGVSDSDTSRWVQAMQAYEARNYEQAIHLFKSIGTSDIHFMESQLLLGNALLLTRNPGAAVLPLRQIADSHDSRFSTTAEWYLLLALVGNHQETEAMKLADKLASDKNHPYQKSAAHVRRDLRSLFR